MPPAVTLNNKWHYWSGIFTLFYSFQYLTVFVLQYERLVYSLGNFVDTRVSPPSKEYTNSILITSNLQKPEH
jgi:hypothetical protein